MSTIGPAADVEIQWQTVMGLRYPAAVRCQTPQRDPLAILDASAALTEARHACQAALAAAVEYAAAPRGSTDHRP